MKTTQKKFINNTLIPAFVLGVLVSLSACNIVEKTEEDLAIDPTSNTQNNPVPGNNSAGITKSDPEETSEVQTPISTNDVFNLMGDWQVTETVITHSLDPDYQADPVEYALSINQEDTQLIMHTEDREFVASLNQDQISFSYDYPYE